MGIEPTPSAWKAGALPLSYTRDIFIVVERTGFEPVKAMPADLQSAPFGQLGYLSTCLAVFFSDMLYYKSPKTLSQ